MSLDPRAVRRRIITCRACPLHAGCRRPVPYRGPTPCSVAVVGEAPGGTEDAYGRPFIGPAGQLLEELAHDAGLDTSAWLFCNIVSCRPPSNRDPDPAEIHACRSNLLMQLAVAAPITNTILLVGRFALNHYLPDAKITAIHGRGFKIASTFYFPILHPAAALRNDDVRSDLAIDMHVFHNFLLDPYACWPETCETCHRDVQMYDETGRAWCRTHYPPRRYSQTELHGMPARVPKPKRRRKPRAVAQSE